ncbi:AAA family ATPase [Caulobacter sp. 17J80-11]|uniref:AAA family ATPase n=1 Tax=Caulobacter sp. 17J80-11 TaxID=2763502 RepID=UPI00165382E6|nr:AAA family ATPase [Caulobacter sp. 17J80-11]MBC6980454.1 AAA family ATPase [Caulobacter sp. 17J80-11]
MPIISSIQIAGLNGVHDLRIQLKDTHCILVGPNGSGKSTALQIIAAALGRQWKRLSELRFHALELTFSNGVIAKLSRSACENHIYAGRQTDRYVRLQKLLNDSGMSASFADVNLKDAATASVYSDILRSSPVEIRQFQHWLRSATNSKASYKEIIDFQSALTLADSPPVLFLPTYRRIELELKRAIDQIPEIYKSQFEKSLQGTDTEFIVELIRFGMEDVTNTLQSFERETKDYARNQFNRMMTSYLKDMARANALSVRELRSKTITASTVDIVLSRIEEGLLSPTEKAEIANVVLELSNDYSAGNPPFHKKWLAHFFIKLMEVNESIQERERPMRSLVETLSKYFTPTKRVLYDVEKYHFSIMAGPEKELFLSDLSSGEKQLVSVLSLLHFSKFSKMNVFIDEPELSLSVPWQFDFLPDIAKAPSCSQVFAVTHSPFIYDNTMSSDVIDFVDCFER